MKCHSLVRQLLLLTSLLLMAACSSSPQSADPQAQASAPQAAIPVAQVVIGVAAAGLPIKGTVLLKDSKGALLGPVSTDSDGNFSFDVTSLAPPFILKATGLSGSQNYTLYSVATGPGNAHITPYSNLALQLATGDDPALAFGVAGSKPDIATIDDAKLKVVLDQIRTLFTPLFAKYGIVGFDPITGSYAATPGNNLDSLLDIIGITIGNNNLTITNKLDGSTLVSGSLANIAALSIDAARCPENSALTDIKDITDRLAVLASAMNKGETLTVQDLAELFIPDPNYGTSNGQTRAEDMLSIVAIFGPYGTNTNGKLKSVRNMRLMGDQTANYTGRGVTKAYFISYDFVFESGKVVNSSTTSWAKDAASGLWKFIGAPVGADTGNNAGFIFTNGGIIDNAGLIITSVNAPPLLLNFSTQSSSVTLTPPARVLPLKH